MSQIGTHETTVLFLGHDRSRLGTIISRDLTEVGWGRTKNEFTQATISLNADKALCNDLEPWLHQVAIFRDDEPVWRGFVYTTAARNNQLTVTARDPSIMFSKRRVIRTQSWRSADPMVIAADVIRDAMAQFDPFGVVQNMVYEPTGLYVDYDVKADEVFVADVLKDMVDAGLVWTVTGGRLVLGPAPRKHVTAGISDVHLDALPTIEKDGSAVVNDLVILGKGASGQYFDYGSGYQGQLQGIEKADALTTEFQCVNEARRQVRKRSVSPRIISMGGSSKLLPTAPVSIEELVPGCLVPVSTETTGVLISTRMELVEVAVKAGRSGDEVSITLGETTTTDPLQKDTSPTNNWDEI
jgi:hypothetical protein